MSNNEDDSSSDSEDSVGNYYDYDDEDDYDTPASSVPRLCAQLRSNDPFVIKEGAKEVFELDVPNYCRLKIAEALLQNTIIKRIGLQLQDYDELSADAMAKYLAQSKHLLYVKLSHERFRSFGMDRFHQQFLSTFIDAIGQSNSVNELNLMNLDLGTASASFENLLTKTKTLRYLQVGLERQEPLEEAATAAIIASSFSKNATLRQIVLVDWEGISLIPVLTALRDHPVLEELYVLGFSSFAGMDILLRGKNSQLKELIIKGSNSVEEVVCFESFMTEMERNTSILTMAIFSVSLSRDNTQQLRAMLRRNTVLQNLDLTGDALGSAGLAEIAPALYRNTSIQSFSVAKNGLDDLVAANALRELLRRNKTITRLDIAYNSFGRNVAAVRCIADGFRANSTLQELDLSSCVLGNQGLSVLADSLGQQKRGLLTLNLSANQITCSGLRALVENATAVLSTVTRLDLGENSVLDEGASFLAETLRLQTLPSLKCLGLKNCPISDDGLVELMSALEENDTLEHLDLEGITFNARGCLALASSLPHMKGLRQIDLSWTTTDHSVVSAMLEGFRENTSLHIVNVAGCRPEHDKLLQELSFLLDRNKFSRLLQDSDTDDRASLGLWSRALGSVATRPDVLFYVLTSKAGLIRATPGGDDSNKRKRDASV
jgi:Ran GTPase-activating protein (RanGAP) involved in mRNA processing and transport